MNKVRVGLVFGGRSGEHEVSIRSARSIFEAIDKNKYQVSLIGVDKSGAWHQVSPQWLLNSSTSMKALPSGNKNITPNQVQNSVDVFFPIIHGTFGEDGSLQGLFELLNVAYVGAGVLGSAVGMDKDVMKRLLSQAGLPVGKYVVFPDKQKFKYPVFVKPANMGSSVGVSKANNKQEFAVAVKLARQFDTKVIVEENIAGREIEISVLGNETPIASLPGEVKATHEFYDYDAKYLDENGAVLEIPANLSKPQIKKAQQLAILTFKALECAGMARVDMFLTPTGNFVINEINTLPGFTSISMYPKLWEASGISYPHLISKLIDLAIVRQNQKNLLQRSYDSF
jgi:D-alanine-D-alanine ligase